MNSSTQTTSATVALSDLPGYVHGIKTLAPVWSVQCDDCLNVTSGEWLLMVAKGATFNNRSDVPHLRLCANCWGNRGWVDSSVHGWTRIGS